MNFEVLKRSHLKRNLIIGVLIIVVLVLCIGLFTKNKTNTLNTTSINKESTSKEFDENLIGAYIQNGDDYTPTSDIPTSGYEFNAEKSYCKIGDAIQEDMTLFYDMDTQTLTVSPIAKEGTKCYLYFDEKASGGDYILAGDNPPTNSTTDWTGGTTYYYTGNPNNWVQFAGFWWRIIRINGDGSIRMIYSGSDATGPATSGTDTQIGTDVFNGSYDQNAYVGYMYGDIYANDYAGTHANTNSSNIKGVLDNWYKNTIAHKRFRDYVDGNSGFCGDRRVSSGTGGGTSSTDYQPSTRVNNNSPSLSCNTNDIYTTKESSTGNKALTYSIGLISADESMLAGISNWNSSGNTNNYLYTGQNYWTMSPSYYSGDAFVLCVLSDGSLNNYYVGDAAPGVRPVINIRANVEITGSGTTSDPFVVVS